MIEKEEFGMNTLGNLILNDVLFLSHGGGPLPLLGDEGHREMVDVLKQIPNRINRPSAILVVSAHWEEKIPTITHGIRPPVIYDYHGFPEESYEILYSAPGEPQLAEAILSCFSDFRIDARLDDARGFDHGLFVPLKIMYPAADIPCVQVSLIKSLDPARHIKIGEALRCLNWEGLLIVGSGFSFHNMREFFRPGGADSKLKNETFENWLIDMCSSAVLDEEERTDRLINWENAPFARFCHPREEHLLPLHVCYGYAKRACREVFEFNVLGRKASAFLW